MKKILNILNNFQFWLADSGHHVEQGIHEIAMSGGNPSEIIPQPKTHFIPNLLIEFKTIKPNKHFVKLNNRQLPIHVKLEPNQIECLTDRNIDALDFTEWRMYINSQIKRVNSKLISKAWNDRWTNKIQQNNNTIIK